MPSRSPSSCRAPARSTVSIGGASQLDVAGILAALDRYPYGCAEQLTSRAMPLLYLDEVAMSIGLGSDKDDQGARPEGDRRGALQSVGERQLRALGTV